MANERSINKVLVAIPIDIETLTKVRRVYSKNPDEARSDYLIRALEESVKGVHLTVTELAECRAYIEEQYRKRMAKREGTKSEGTA